MNDLLLLLISCVGTNTILMHGKILNRFRDWITKFSFFSNMFKCPLCLGFHVGWGLSLLYVLLVGKNPLVIFVAPASSILCLFSEELLDLIGNINNKLENDALSRRD